MRMVIREWGTFLCFCFLELFQFGGTYTLYQHQETNILIFLPAAAIGLLSTAVLNLNNMRDMETDKKSGKHTLPLKMGYKNAQIYQSFLVVLPFVLAVIYLILSEKYTWYYFSFLILLFPVFLFIKTLY